MVAGKPLPGPGEAIVPAALAGIAGIRIGDKVSIAGREFVVAGLSGDTFSMANPVRFVTMDDLSDIMSTVGSVSYMLVDAAPGVDAVALAERIRDSVEKVNALPRQEFAGNDWSLAMQMGLEIVGLMTVIGNGLAVPLTEWFVPQVSLGVTDAALFRVGAMAVIVGLAASVLPVRRILSVDPVTAFNQ